MRERTLKDLEFDRVLELVRKHSLYDGGLALIDPSSVSSDESVLKERADYIEDILMKLEEGKVQLQQFPSLSALFRSAAASHAAFDGEEIFAAGLFIESLEVLAAFLESDELVRADASLLSKDISQSLSSDGSVKETHPQLVPLIREAEEAKAKRYSYSQSFVSAHPDLTRGLNPVYRSGRVVLPITREEKAQVPGYVQGTSGSGNTLFIESFELVALNNNVVLAEEAVMRMKQKIIAELSSRVRELIPYLRAVSRKVSTFDFHYSLALFVKETHSTRASFSKSLRLIGARHPLLFERAVPITLKLDEDVKAVVISGANAGGKSVTLKCAALLVLIAELSGFITAEEGSSVPLYKHIYTDIGDGQSISENFSTFSSHMSNVASICLSADEDTLILLDELGSGTDPDEGAALTVALLDHLSAIAGLTLITSHYSQVKMHAYNTPHMLNASMEFDEETSRPTYRVIEGLPGDSHAIAIARRMGIPKEVIRSAKEQLGTGATVSRLIEELGSKQRALDRKITQAEIEKRTLMKKQQEAEEARKQSEEAQRRALKEGAEELTAFMKQTRRELEKLVKDVSEGKLTREKTLSVKSYIRSLEKKEEEVREEVMAQEEKASEELHYDFKVGDEVLCGAYGRRGVILEARGKGKWLIALDNLRMTLPEKDLRIAEGEKKASVSPFKVTAPKPKLTLDVRGYTLKEALSALDEEIEGCLVHGLSSFSVIHGYGDGILSRGIHEHLKGQRSVRDFYFANPEDGGMGKTYVFF